MSIATLTPQDLSRESYVTAARRQVTKNALTSLTQNWTWRELLMPRQDILASQETTPKTLKDDETVAKRLSKRLSSSSQNASKDSKEQDSCQPHVGSNLSTIAFNNQKLAGEVQKWRDSVRSRCSEPLQSCIPPGKPDDKSPQSSERLLLKDEVKKDQTDLDTHGKPLVSGFCQPRRPRSRNPACIKTVHFAPDLEQICHFYHTDRPSAVNSVSALVDDWRRDKVPSSSHHEWPCRRASSYYWVINTPNFPQDAVARQSMPVRLDEIKFSAHETAIVGSVVVANLDFRKSVACHYTLDYWKTVSETEAIYNADQCGRNQDYDVFIFKIDLTECIDLEYRPMFLCIRYLVGVQEFWDNNSYANFQVDFIKIGRRKKTAQLKV
ncbi:phosphatase regulator [Fusarium acutatum]|uniref:Phosphatase regulator n=1 Tax=Fusarium acutatum TaxID=78861 RepID=A0A8H4NJT0_9HYPO|nr:phosphatase regulator [Fusarium acutatum]